MNHIENLKKVTVSIKALDERGQVYLPRSKTLSFIYGTASEGLCPLEVALYDKNIGDSVKVDFNRASTHEFYGHLFFSFRSALGLQIIPEQLDLEITVDGVEEADNREIVKAIAKSMASGSCGGDCDCGCG